MTLPASFLKDGFVPPANLRRRHRRLMIGTDGPSNTGKTEFALSAPGPGLVISLDRGFDAMMDNPQPPPTRRTDFAFKVVQAPLASQTTKENYLAYWQDFYGILKTATANADCRTIVIDGDSDSWELQRLAEFGKLTQVPSILYTTVNAARRAMYARLWDSGKIIIATNKIKKEYKTLRNPDGTPRLNDQGKEVREWDGASYNRQGFEDQDYLWQIQIRHLFRNTTNGPEWGLKIMKAKADPSLEGIELWGGDCHFAALVQTVYPHVPLAEWGY